jgi:hypothetical protein
MQFTTKQKIQISWPLPLATTSHHFKIWCSFSPCNEVTLTSPTTFPFHLVFYKFLFHSLVMFHKTCDLMWINICLAYFPYFEKIKVGLWDHFALCVSPPIVGRKRLSKCPLIIARQRLGKNHPIVARQRLGKNPLTVARQRLGKNPPMLLGNSTVKLPLSLLGNGSVETLPRQRIHMEQQKNWWTRHSHCGPCRIKESRQLVLPRTSCFFPWRLRLMNTGQAQVTPIHEIDALSHQSCMPPWFTASLFNASKGWMASWSSKASCYYDPCKCYHC